MNDVNTLFVAWRSKMNNRSVWGPVGRLDRVRENPDRWGYRFRYTRGATTLEGFTPFVGFPYFDEVYNSDDLLPLFSNRLMNRSRPEYRDYLRWSGFDPNHPPSPLSILAVTEGRRVTDSVEVFPCPQKGENGYVNRFFVHGIRHLSTVGRSRVDSLTVNEQLHIASMDPPHDSLGVTVRSEDGVHVGHLPRYLTRDVRTLLQECDCDPLIHVERTNIDAPMNHRVLCRMESCWPDDFSPCSGDDFLPLVE